MCVLLPKCIIMENQLKVCIILLAGPVQLADHKDHIRRLYIEQLVTLLSFNCHSNLLPFVLG